MITRFQVALFFIYGTVLCIAAWSLAGFGHGSYLLLALAGAPASLLGVPAGSLSCLFQWGLLAVLLRRWKRAPVFVIGFLILHYGAAGFALHLMLSPEDTDLKRLNGMLPGFTAYLCAALIWYLGGQIVLWITTLKGVSANWAESRNAPGE